MSVGKARKSLAVMPWTLRGSRTKALGIGMFMTSHRRRPARVPAIVVAWPRQAFQASQDRDSAYMLATGQESEEAAAARVHSKGVWLLGRSTGKRIPPVCYGSAVSVGFASELPASGHAAGWPQAPLQPSVVSPTRCRGLRGMPMSQLYGASVH